MAVEVGMEDDVFFADLSRQISLLIDDDDHHDDPVAHFPSSLPQIRLSQSTIHPSMLVSSSQYLYPESCRREYAINSKGTGVFIPQWPQLRRKYKDQRKRAKFNSNKHFISNSKGTSDNGVSQPLS